LIIHNWRHTGKQAAHEMLTETHWNYKLCIAAI